MLDRRHNNSNTDQPSDFWPLELLATQLAKASEKDKSAIAPIFFPEKPFFTLHTVNQLGIEIDSTTIEPAAGQEISSPSRKKWTEGVHWLFEFLL